MSQGWGTTGTESRADLRSVLLLDHLWQGDDIGLLWGYLKPPRTNSGFWLMPLAWERISMGLGPLPLQVKHFNKTSAKSKVITKHR